MNHEEYQDRRHDPQAFQLKAVPRAPRLYAGLDKAMEYIDGAYVDLYLADNGDQQRIIADDILYVTPNGRIATVVTDEKGLSGRGKNTTTFLRKAAPAVLLPGAQNPFWSICTAWSAIPITSWC